MVGLRVLIVDMPIVLRCALSPHMLALRNGKVEYGEPCYRLVYRQGGRSFGTVHYGWQMQMSFGGKLRRLAHTREAVLAGLVAAAVLLDATLCDQTAVAAWVHEMVEGGETAAVDWLGRVDLTRMPKVKVCKGRSRVQK
tara:strand:+ start:3133 stop:3549 length:417 start_codon:yes stop_codon:yes gene_type:complete